MLEFTLSIETWGPGGQAFHNDERLDEFPGALESCGALGAAGSAGGVAGGIGATFGVEADGAPEWVFAEVCNRGVQIFLEACEKVGFERPEIAWMEFATERYVDAQLSQEPERYVGVTEVAKELGVSKQRASEIRTRPDFPAPLAELASGPVWTLSSLKRFVAEWPRKPGRPRRHDAA